MHTIKNPATTSWGLNISDSDFKKFKAGRVPKNQDQKWHVLMTDQDESENVLIHFAQFSNGEERIRLSIKPGDGANTSARIETITWDQTQRPNLSGEQCKKSLVTISRNILGCDYDQLPKDFSSE